MCSSNSLATRRGTRNLIYMLAFILLNLLTTSACLLYTSDAADEEDSVDLGGRRIIKIAVNTNLNPNSS